LLRCGRTPFVFESYSRVCCATTPPPSSNAIWRSRSTVSAFSTYANELMFFTSVFVPSAVSPARRTETLASTRRLPFSISQSEIPAYSSTCFSVWR